MGMVHLQVFFLSLFFSQNQHAIIGIWREEKTYQREYKNKHDSIEYSLFSSSLCFLCWLLQAQNLNNVRLLFFFLQTIHSQWNFVFVRFAPAETQSHYYLSLFTGLSFSIEKCNSKRA